MFSSFRHNHKTGFIEYRTEDLTGIRARICPERLKRRIGTPEVPHYESSGCPFCPDMVESVTPVFPDGKRIHIGESVTFPNLYPFAKYHVVTVITLAHQVSSFTPKQLEDSFTAQVLALSEQDGYSSINWNYLPSAGASLPHPHLQGLSDSSPDTLPGKYIQESKKYLNQKGENWYEYLIKNEINSSRTLEGLSLFWYAHPVPVGEREIRCILPITTSDEFLPYISQFSSDLVRILTFLNELGTGAWNMAVFFGCDEDKSYYRAFCTLISRINPNSLSTSDSAFMERLHLEPVIMTLPEDLAQVWGEFRINKIG